MKIVVFDISSDYGHFRKYWTTTSPLTYSFIPPTAIYGIISSIIGIDKLEYLKYINYSTVMIAQRIINPIQKTRIAINLIDTKKERTKIKLNKIEELDNWYINNRTQIRFEFLKKPHFRLYVHLTDEKLFTKLENRLKNNQSYYTVCMGLSELIAETKFIGTYQANEINQLNQTEIHTIIPLSKIANQNITFEDGKTYVKERVTISFTPQRKIDKIDDILLETNGKTIKCSTEKFYRIEELNENIVFL